MRRQILWLTAIAVCLGGAFPSAHEIGTTRVSAVFAADDTYDIELVTDAAALIEKLNAASGRHSGGPVTIRHRSRPCCNSSMRCSGSESPWHSTARPHSPRSHTRSRPRPAFRLPWRRFD